jgi:elongation factor G
MDKAGANFLFSVKTIEEKLNAKTLICQLPIGSENNLEGIIDLIENKAYYFKFGDKEENYQSGLIPSSLLKEVEKNRQLLIEKLVELDESL